MRNNGRKTVDGKMNNRCMRHKTARPRAGSTLKTRAAVPSPTVFSGRSIACGGFFAAGFAAARCNRKPMCLARRIAATARRAHGLARKTLPENNLRRYSQSAPRWKTPRRGRSMHHNPTNLELP